MDSHAHLAARLAELAARGGRSRFLEPGESVALAQKAAREAGVDVAFWGGYPRAERTVAAFYWAEPPQEFPLRACGRSGMANTRLLGTEICLAHCWV